MAKTPAVLFVLIAVLMCGARSSSVEPEQPAMPAIHLPSAPAGAPPYARPAEVEESITRTRAAALHMRRVLAQLEARLALAEGTEKGRLTVAIALLKEEDGDLDAADRAYGSVVDGTVPATPADAVQARMRQGYIDIARKDRPAALEHFAPIASGEIPADIATATDAGLRVAALHRLLKNWREAEHAWREVARQTPIAERARYARLQVCGLLVETAKGDYGLLPTESDRADLIKKAIDESVALYSGPEVEPETKATAESIEIWALAISEDWQRVNDLALPYVMRWSEYMDAHPYTIGDEWDPGRQIVTMQTWLLMSQFQLKEYNACKRTAQMIRLGAWTNDVPYQNFNAFAYSYAYEILCNEAQDRNDDAADLRATATTELGDSFNTTLDQIRGRASRNP